jgi:hypothetical protein
MLKGGLLQTGYKLQFYNKEYLNKRMECTITYKIYNLKNDRLQKQANQVFVQCVQDIKS